MCRPVFVLNVIRPMWCLKPVRLFQPSSRVICMQNCFWSVYYVISQYYITLFTIHMQPDIYIILGVGLEFWLFIDVVSSMHVICRRLCWKNCLSSLIFTFFNHLAPEFSLKFLAHPVFKIWVLQEPKKVALWNKRHLEEKKTENVQHV